MKINAYLKWEYILEDKLNTVMLKSGIIILGIKCYCHSLKSIQLRHKRMFLLVGIRDG